MSAGGRVQLDRRRFAGLTLAGLAGLAAAGPSALARGGVPPTDAADTDDEHLAAVVRPPTLFAGIRAPLAERAELGPRVVELDRLCAGRIVGPLTHIYRFDTPVEGFDSELGYPVSEAVDRGRVVTHELREQHFHRRRHRGPIETVGETAGTLYEGLRRAGLSPELELVEVFPEHRPAAPFGPVVDVMASYLAWPEVYRAQLDRVLGSAAAAAVWHGGEALTPFTPVDPRAAWVGASIERLRRVATTDQQYDVLSRVALVRPPEDVRPYREIYLRTGDVTAVLRALDDHLKGTRTGGFVDPPHCDGRVLHCSKVPRDGAAYAAATNQGERRRAFCFCNLVRCAAAPRIDPVFCYRAAGWSRQLWESVLGRRLDRCTVTHSILQGDRFCAWDFQLEPTPEPVHRGAV